MRQETHTAKYLLCIVGICGSPFLIKFLAPLNLELKTPKWDLNPITVWNCYFGQIYYIIVILNNNSRSLFRSLNVDVIDSIYCLFPLIQKEAHSHSYKSNPTNRLKRKLLCFAVMLWVYCNCTTSLFFFCFICCFVFFLKNNETLISQE